MKTGRNAEPFDKKQLTGKMPDNIDRQNIVEMIKTYDTAFPYPNPYSIGAVMEDALRDIDNAATTQTVHTSTGTSQQLKADAGNVRRLSLPRPFMDMLKKAYPLIITDDGQYQWFLSSFPHLDLTMYEHGTYRGPKK